MRRALGTLAVLAVLVAGCSDNESAEPDPDRESTTTTAFIDRSGIALAPVPGETTTTIDESGTARLVGAVRGPQGLVPGATVRIERLVAGREIRTDVVTGDDGRFVLDRVPGGRYSVRAFAPPALVQLDPIVRFLNDAEEHAFDLVVEDHAGLVVRASAAPEAPVVDGPVNVAVAVAERRVDGDGIVRTVGLAGVTVRLTGLGRWVLRDDATGTTGSSSSTASARTDGGGQVRFGLRCEAPGDPGLALRIPVTVAAAPAAPGGDPTATTTPTAPQVREEVVALELPPCTTPTTTTTAPSTSGSTSSTTSTTEDDG